MLSLSLDDYLWFVDEALAGMAAIVTELGDDLANRRPDLPGANSPYAILTHCLGVMEWWGGHAVAGRVVERDRDAEFRATGPVAALVARVDDARDRLRADVAALDSAAPLRGTDGLWPGDADLPIARTQAGALIHVYEELAQHRGQMEGARDVLVAGSR
jgi:hypothetical protein